MKEKKKSNQVIWCSSLPGLIFFFLLLFIFFIMHTYIRFGKEFPVPNAFSIMTVKIWYCVTLVFHCETFLKVILG